MKLTTYIIRTRWYVGTTPFYDEYGFPTLADARVFLASLRAQGSKASLFKRQVIDTRIS